MVPKGINRMNWVTVIKYVNLETGEEISKRTKQETRQEIKNKYIIIKIKKHVKTDKYQTTGVVEYTIECRRNPQGELNFG